MMAPWQVWAAEIGVDDATQFMVIVSSPFHLRITVGRICLALPLVAHRLELDYRVAVEHPGESRQFWVAADQLRMVTAPLLPTGWALQDHEVAKVKDTLKHMVDI